MTMERQPPRDAMRESAGSRLEIHLLGGFRIVRDGVAVPESWRTEKARTLVKLLALAPDHLLQRDQVLDWLWPETAPEVATNNLYFVLHAARRTLDTGTGTASSLQFRGGIVRLQPAGGLATDVIAFESAAQAALGDNTARQYEEALACYAGDLLPEDRYEEWAIGRREVLRETYLRLLSRLADLHAARGEWDAVIARLEQVLAADSTREPAHAGLMRAFAATGQRARALRQYADLRLLMRHEFAIEPDPSTQALYAAILAGQTPGHADTLAAVVPASALPVPLTRFIGRKREITAVRRLLADPERRLVTLTGSGGCGKTRLALEVVRGLATDGDAAVVLVELAALHAPGLLPGAVAQSCGVREVPGQAMAETLIAGLRASTLLLVLDNCEHLLDACAELVTALLAACPLVRVLTTSREALQIPGEVVWRVPSLTLPPPPEQLGSANWRADVYASEAVQLLIDRITLRRPGFTITAAQATALALICHRLDGIPLALELAAARAGAVDIEEVAARLDDMLGFLIRGGRAVPPRHQTLRAVLEWSEVLLDAGERTLLRRLAVFAGGGTLAAIEAVCGAVSPTLPIALPIQNNTAAAPNSAGSAHQSPGLRPAMTTLDTLARLVEKSLVQVEETGGALRYRLLEMTRQYAAERLAAQGEMAALREQHLRYYLALAEHAEPHLYRASQVHWLGSLDREEDNLRAALRQALDQHDAERMLRLAGALSRYWLTRWKLDEGRDWLAHALGLAESHLYPAARAKALFGLASLSWRFGEPTRVEADLRESLALARANGLSTLVGDVLRTLSLLRKRLGAADADDYAHAAVASLRAVGDLPRLGSALNTLAEWSRLGGDYHLAISQYEEAIAAARQSGEQQMVALVCFNLGFARLRLANADGARSALAESTRLNVALGKRGIEGPTLEAAAALACVEGQPHLTARFYGAAQNWHDLVGRAQLDPADQAEHDYYVARASAALGPEGYAAAAASGQAISPATAFGEARSFLGC